METFNVPIEVLWLAIGTIGGYIIRQLKGNGTK